MNTIKGLFRPLHAAGLLAVSALALTLSTALPTQATSTGARYLAGATGLAGPGAEAVAVSRVLCPRGTTVQSGGYSTVRRGHEAAGGFRPVVLASHPVFDDPNGRTGWYVSASHADVTAHVLCRPSDTGD
ncbi:hypothetical protein ACFWBF_06175 [Streptomyces sp. NPDC060028]|uniref:hypothetical protein n=1 Tax=Streptomyces sp. NPDC060028 TaxID=3347041 RepID=UPI00369D8BD9